jgi:hypothetical protein
VTKSGSQALQRQDHIVSVLIHGCSEEEDPSEALQKAKKRASHVHFILKSALTLGRDFIKPTVQPFHPHLLSSVFEADGSRPGRSMSSLRRDFTAQQVKDVGLDIGLLREPQEMDVTEMQEYHTQEAVEMKLELEAHQAGIEQLFSPTYFGVGFRQKSVEASDVSLSPNPILLSTSPSSYQKLEEPVSPHLPPAMSNSTQSITQSQGARSMLTSPQSQTVTKDISKKPALKAQQSVNIMHSRQALDAWHPTFVEDEKMTGPLLSPSSSSEDLSPSLTSNPLFASVQSAILPKTEFSSFDSSIVRDQRNLTACESQTAVVSPRDATVQPTLTRPASTHEKSTLMQPPPIARSATVAPTFEAIPVRAAPALPLALQAQIKDFNKPAPAHRPQIPIGNIFFAPDPVGRPNISPPLKTELIDKALRRVQQSTTTVAPSVTATPAAAATQAAVIPSAPLPPPRRKKPMVDAP